MNVSQKVINLHIHNAYGKMLIGIYFLLYCLYTWDFPVINKITYLTKKYVSITNELQEKEENIYSFLEHKWSWKWSFWSLLALVFMLLTRALLSSKIWSCWNWPYPTLTLDNAEARSHYILNRAFKPTWQTCWGV